jgi:epoxyqueuosine reductase
LRQRLQALATRMEAAMGPLGYRVFTDSAPLLEVELASRSGQGWRGKHTLTLSREAGSAFFLGEILVNRPLPSTAPVAAHCGSCTACIDVCPTGAIVAPYRLDARRCISYLTIEHAGPIPLDLRPLMGNRIYGCDDCQLACPWNKFAQPSMVPDFDERAVWQSTDLAVLLGWSEAEFLAHTEGSPLRRIGHERWRRNLAVAAGNALGGARSQAQPHGLSRDAQTRLRAALQQVQAEAGAGPGSSPLVQEHVSWALDRAVEPIKP